MDAISVFLLEDQQKNYLLISFFANLISICLSIATFIGLFYFLYKKYFAKVQAIWSSVHLRGKSCPELNKKRFKEKHSLEQVNTIIQISFALHLLNQKNFDEFFQFELLITKFYKPGFIGSLMLLTDIILKRGERIYGRKVEVLANGKPLEIVGSFIIPEGVVRHLASEVNIFESKADLINSMKKGMQFAFIARAQDVKGKVVKIKGGNKRVKFSDMKFANN